MIIVARVRYWLAWIRWAWVGPYRMGDPLLGEGWIRDQNRRLLRDRWNAREPKLEHFVSRGNPFWTALLTLGDWLHRVASRRLSLGRLRQ